VTNHIEGNQLKRLSQLMMEALLVTAILLSMVPDLAHAAPIVEESKLKGELTISAATSTTDAFTELVKQFRKVNKVIKVRLNFGSSSTLVAQIQAGAPSDIMASADLATLEKLVASGNVAVTPKVFAQNTMVIAVKPGNPKSVRSVADLAALPFIALCGKTMPCGVYASRVLTRAGVIVAESKVTRGIDVKATLSAVTNGDADAAIVYKTDVLAAKRTVIGIGISSAQNVKAMYGIAPIRGSKNPANAKAFIDFVMSEQGWQILKSFGFERP
jgi:molybdate transport system substrate-binding protein